jgi:di/tricarboxylate transporter
MARFAAMGWKLLQITVFLACMFANIYYGWTDNGFVASVNAGFAAMFVTWLLSKAIDLVRGWRQRRLLATAHERSNDRRNLRIDR